MGNNSVVGEFLHIPDGFIEKIKAAEKEIENLQKSSQKATEAIKGHFGTTAVQGVDAFIKKLQEAQKAASDLKMPNVQSFGISEGTATNLTAAVSSLVTSMGQLQTMFDKIGAGGRQTAQTLQIDEQMIKALTTAASDLQVSLGGASERLQQLISLKTSGPSTSMAMAAMSEAAERVNKKLTEQVEILRANNATAQATIAAETTALTDLQTQLDRTKSLKQSLLATGRDEKNSFVKQYTAEIAALETKISSALDRISQMKNTVTSNADQIARLNAEISRPYSTATLSAFSEQLRTMSRSDIETVIRQLQMMQSEMSKTSDGRFPMEFKKLEEYLKVANKELDRTTSLIGEIKKKYDWSNSLPQMTTRGNYADEIKSLQELKDLQQALYNEINRSKDINSEATRRAIQAYQNVSKEVRRYEEQIRGVEAAEERAAKKSREIKPAGLEPRSLDEIINATNAAHLGLDQLKADLKSVNESMKQQTAFGAAFIPPDQIRAAQELANAIAFIEREQKGLNTTMQAQAAMARYSIEGFNGIAYSVRNTATSSAQLKRDLADLKVIQSRLSPNTNEWKQFNQLIGETEKRIKDLQRAEESLKASAIKMKDLEAPKAGATYNELKRHIEDVKKALKNLDPNTAEWRKLNKELEKSERRFNSLRKKMGEVQASAQKTSGMFGQLKNYIVMAFSIQAIQGFLTKMVEVHAQLQLQQVALRAILQDKEKADQIFASVKNMALQSPFTIAQLTTYTKQLAAYRVESEKLVGTTKMLADVSAGLGVDMQRLILAYGQVKSANYLRACLGRGTKILTTRGVVCVEDIKVGDKLYNDRHEITIVSELYRGIEQMYNVRALDRGYDYRVNQSHIMTVYDKAVNAVVDIRVSELLRAPHRYLGVRYDEGEVRTYPISVELDIVDEYFGFKLDGNKRFQLYDGTITHNTEVRQFTEAGLNIAGELSKYFTELRGQMVSVADVMEMITKRMVKFEDVEEVFKRITASGGLFYDMQKKQSETVYGMMQRIKDAYTIMMDEIGTSNEGTIKSALQFIRDLLGAWRSVIPVLKVAGWLIGGFFVAKLITMRFYVKQLAMTFRELQASIMGATAAEEAFNAAQKTNVWILLASVILAVVQAIYELATATDELDEKWNRLRADALTESNTQIAKMRELLNVVSDVTKSYSEQNDALQEIQRTYSDIFGSELQSIENVRKMADQWSIVKSRMKEYYAEQTANAMRQETETTYAKKFTDDIEDILDALEDSVREVLPEYEREIGRSFLYGILENLKKNDYEIADYYGTTTTLIKRLGDYYNKTLSDDDIWTLRVSQGLFTEAVNDNMADLFKDVNEYKDKLDKIDVSALYEGDTKKFIEFNDGLRERDELLEKYKNLLTEVGALNKRGEFVFSTDNWLAGSGPLVSEINKILKDLGVADYGANVDALLADASSVTAVEEAYNRAAEASDLFWQNETKNTRNFNDIELLRVDKTFSDRAAKRAVTEVEGMIIEIKKKVSKEKGVELSLFDNISTQNLRDAAKDAKSIYENLADNIKRVKIEMANETDPILQHMFVVQTLGMELADAEKNADALLTIMKRLGEEPKNTGGKGRDPFAERLNLMKKVNAEYEKLLKYYDEETVKAKILKSYAEAAKEVFGTSSKFADINTWQGFDKKQTADNLRELLNSSAKIAAETRKAIQEEIGRLDVEIGIEVQENALDEAKKQFESIFDNYELTKTLADIGVNIDLAYSVGGTPTTLDQIRAQLEAVYEDAKANNLGKDLLDAYKSALKKLDDLENKSQIERVKNLEKYLLESVSKRVQIEVKAQREINKIRENQDMDAATKQMATDQVNKKKQQDLDKQAWEDFKSSGLYVRLFDNLEQASNKSVGNMLTKLQELRTSLKDLPPQDLKTIIDLMDKLRAQQAEHKPFATIAENFGDAINYLRKRNEWEQKYAEGLQYQSGLKDTLNEKEKDYLDSVEKLKILQNKPGADADELTKMQRHVAQLEQDIANLKKLLKDSETATGVLADNLQNGSAATSNTVKALDKVKSQLSSLTRAGDTVINSLETMGVSSQSFKDTWESAKEAFGGIEDGIDAVKAGLSGNYYQAALSGIMAVFKVAAAFVGLSDKRKQREIENQKKHVDELTKAYEKLEKAMNNAYQFENYKQSGAEAVKNLKEQMYAYKKMAQLEEDKKNTDADKLKEYNDEVSRLVQEIQDKQSEITKQLGGFGADTRFDAAQQFVETWLDAYKETGDGLDALNEQWDEYIENLLMRQAAYRLVGRRMENFFDQIDAMANADATKDMKQILAEIQELQGDVLGEANRELKEFFDYFGWGAGGNLLLSDLQKGIQNITEAQAAALESITNSIRFGVYKQLDTMTELLNTVRSQYSRSDTPILSEIKAIRTAIDRIDTNLSSVIRRSGGPDNKPYVRIN